MSLPVPEELIDFINKGSSFVVVGHEEPDGDCIGGQLALCSLLRRMGKNAVPSTAGPFERTEIKPFVKYFLPFPSNREKLQVFIMDCSTPDRVGELPIDRLPSAIVDHHSAGVPFGDVVYLDPEASSVCFLVEKIFTAMGKKPTKEEAEFLLFGICTDTGFFRHLDEKGAETFSTASRLVALGANPKKIYAIMNGGRNLDSRLLAGVSLSKTRSYYGGKLLVTDECLHDLEKYGHESRDSDLIYRLLQSVEGVEAVAIVREENKEECSIGLRSRDRIDVAAIAKSFGGGGHKNAAGAKLPGPVTGLEEKLVAAFREFFG